MANEQIAVGASAEYQVTWFDGPNGTGNVVSATVASVWSSGSEANLTAVSDGMQTAMVTGIAAGTGIDVTATDPTSGTQAAPLAFDVTSVIVPPGPIVSGVITRVPPAAAALR